MDLDSLFSYEFGPVSFALCGSQNFNLLNQQQKSEIMKLFEEQCSIAFLINSPVMNDDKYALIIDGCPLLEIKPNKPSSSILDYAKQLLLSNVLPECQYYGRIDIIFDSHKSKQIKSFTKASSTSKQTTRRIWSKDDGHFGCR